MDDDVKRLIQQSAAETRQHFDVVAEGLRRQVQLVAEGVSSIGERTERLTTRLDQLKDGMHRMKDGIHREFEEVRSIIRLS